MEPLDEKFGIFLGFVATFFISTLIFYMILNLLGKIPSNWGYFHIFLTLTSVVLIGILIKLWFR